MINIRTGNYTSYLGYECQLFEVRTEVPTSELDMKFSVCYSSAENLKLNGFQKHAYADLFCKTVNYNDLKNAYSVNTFGIYKGVMVQVFGKRLDNINIVEVGTNSYYAFKELGFLELDPNWYIKDVNIDEIDEIWEERSTFQGFPMPEGLIDKVYLKK